MKMTVHNLYTEHQHLLRMKQQNRHISWTVNEPNKRYRLLKNADIKDYDVS